jgi:hypothetical protein
MSTDVLSLATKNATLWTSDIFDEATRAEAQALLDKGGDDLIEPFYLVLQLREILKVDH